jgi:hypothetical protein
MSTIGDKICAILIAVAFLIIAIAIYGSLLPCRSNTTLEYQETFRLWCKEKKVCHAAVIYDYPENPYIYWKGNKVFLNK